MGLGHSGESGRGDWHNQGLCVVRPTIGHHIRSVFSLFLSTHESDHHHHHHRRSSTSTSSLASSNTNTSFSFLS